MMYLGFFLKTKQRCIIMILTRNTLKRDGTNVLVTIGTKTTIMLDIN